MPLMRTLARSRWKPKRRRIALHRRKGNQRNSLTSGEYSSIKEINNTVLATKGVYISVTKQSGTNAVKVADALYEKLAELKETLPSDIQIEVISDDSTTIRQTLNTLFTTAWQGILLAVLVLFVFLKSFKSTFITLILIPVLYSLVMKK